MTMNRTFKKTLKQLFSVTFVAGCVATMGIFSQPFSKCAQTAVFAMEEKNETAQIQRPDLIIDSPEGLKEFAQEVSDGNDYSNKIVVLANDLIFDGTIDNFETIGTEQHGFNGIFDGCGHTVSGIDQRNGCGLFYQLGKDGFIKNLRFENSTLDATSNSYHYISGIAAINNGQIVNCRAFNVSINVEGQKCGGITAQNNGIINNCLFAGTITVFDGLMIYDNVGGIAAINANCIYNSCNLGTIEGKPSDSYYSDTHFNVGGIAGATETNDKYSDVIMQNCYSIGHIENLTTSDSHENYVGGLVGRFMTETIISDCFCSNECTQTIFGLEDNANIQNCSSLPDSDMKTSNLVSQLNKKQRADWNKWDFYPESDYPMPSFALSISDCVVQLNKTSFRYNGEEHKPEAAVYHYEEKLTESVDYSVSYRNNVKAGNAEVEIIGLGDYQGKISKTFTIEQIWNISDCLISLEQDTFLYTGTQIRPGVTVTNQDKTLVNGSDYTITYKDNVNAGTAEMIITGMGDYEGTASIEFTIKNPLPGDIDQDGTVSLEDAQLALRTALGIQKLINIEQQIADVDQDSQITLEDAQLILQAALGIIDL